MIDRFATFPKSLQPHTRTVRLPSRIAEEIPALLIHPDWSTPAPVVIWMHGRTAHKEIDAGRFQRWLRAGIAACSIDLPGHGERAVPEHQGPEYTLRMVQQAVAEIDSVIEALADPAHAGAFDIDRMGLGGMSAGGIVSLRRLCDPHPFGCAAVEGTTGSLERMPLYPERHGTALLTEMNPLAHLDTWRPIPLLALHSEADAWVRVEGIREFTEALKARYRSLGADESKVQLRTWPETGAPHEHLGFGRVSNDAKNLQTEFLKANLIG
jgi:alpha-beta hydrolase superfamily lysophospholipase